MPNRRLAGLALALSTAAAPVFAQSLADVARAEEARRARAPKPVKGYSNADLGPGSVRDQAPADAPAAKDESCYRSKQSGRCVTAEEMLANSQAMVKVVQDAPSEAPIRDEAETIRKELSRLQQLVDALQEQERDASLTAAKRQAATDGLAMHRPSLAGFQRRWARLERQVKELKLPHAWIEPVPENARPQ